jgi:hypothetical protein
MVRYLCRGNMASKVLTTITLLTLTACGEEQLSLPVMHAASALQATGQSPASPYSSSHIQEPRMQKPGIDMRRITNEIYETTPPQYCYSQGDQETNVQVQCRHG